MASFKCTTMATLMQIVITTTRCVKGRRGGGGGVRGGGGEGERGESRLRSEWREGYEKGKESLPL